MGMRTNIRDVLSDCAGLIEWRSYILLQDLWLHWPRSGSHCAIEGVSEDPMDASLLLSPTGDCASEALFDSEAIGHFFLFTYTQEFQVQQILILIISTESILHYYKNSVK